MKHAKLRGRIVEKYGTQTAFAEAIGCTRGNVSYHLEGKRDFTKKIIEKWAKALDLSVEDYGPYFFT